MQYSTELPAFQKEQVFTPSLFVTLRRRLGLEGVNKTNELVLEQAKSESELCKIFEKTQ